MVFESYGYDARVSNDFKIFTNVNSTTVIKKFKKEGLFQENQKYVLFHQIHLLWPERLSILRVPENVMVICLGKSTYARCGIIVNVTPLNLDGKVM